jgi:ubiquinone/menaquinone biosynthesis C-methylase UbiE
MTSGSDPHQRQQLAYYEQGADDYERAGFLHRGLTYAYERKAEIIASALRDLQLERTIEVGAGSGLMTYFLCDRLSGRIVAQDLSAEMLAAAKSRISDPRVSYLVGDASAIDSADDSFDAIVGVDVIHHLEDPRGAMLEWRRVARQGARLAFLESNAYNPLNLRNIGVEHEVRSFLNTPANLAAWATEAGWSGVSVRAAPSYTPSGPKVLRPLLNLIDRVGPMVPGFRNLTALWLLTASA